MSCPSSMSTISRTGSPCPRPPGSRSRRERIDLAAGREQQQLVGGFGTGRSSFSRSPALKPFSSTSVGVALERADPALFGEDDGDRLALDEGGRRLLRGRRRGRRRRWCGGGRARCRGAVVGLEGGDLLADLAPLALVARRAARRDAPAPRSAPCAPCGARSPRACAASAGAC